MTYAPAYHTHERYLALLAAVRANPADDLPRLVLADWLDEQGEGGRAELVRYQVATGGVADVYGRLRGFAGDAPPGVSATLFAMPDVRTQFARGFVAECRLSFAEWVQHAARLLPESLGRAGLTVRLTDRPVVEVDYRRANGKIVNYWTPAVEAGARRVHRLVGEAGWRSAWHPVHEGAAIVETVLAAEWPDVATWGVPEYRFDEYIADDLRRSYHPDLWPAMGVEPMSRGPMVDRV